MNGLPTSEWASSVWASVWAMVRREWTEWRLLLLGALLLGWIPWMTPWMPAMGHMDPAEARAATCLMVGGLFAVSTLLLLGASLQRDAAAGRLSFYLARPISAAAYWLGRCLGAFSLWLGSLGLVVGPTVAAEVGFLGRSSSSLAPLPLTAIGEASIFSHWLPAPGPLSDLLFLLGLLVASAGLMLTVSWVAAASRVRGPWLGLDVFGAILLGALMWTMRDDLVAAQAFGGLVWLERLWIVSWVPILLWAGYRQIELGRVDSAAAYAVFSRHVWSGIAGLALACLALAGWILSGDSRDLATLESLSLSPTGDQIFVSGELRGRAGRHQSFLLELDRDAGDGPMPTRETEAGGLFPSVEAWRFSADGSRAFWGRCRRVVWTDCELWTRDLTSDEAARGTGIKVSSTEVVVAVSPSGRHVAVGTRSGIEVYGIGAQDGVGKLMTAVRTEPVNVLAFIDDRFLRSIHRGEDPEDPNRIRELDLSTKVVRETGALPMDMYRRAYVFDRNSGLALFLGVAPRRYELRDAVTGALRLDLNSELGLDDDLLISALFLPGRRLALLSHRVDTVDGPVDDSSGVPAVVAHDYTLHLVDLSPSLAPASPTAEQATTEDPVAEDPVAEDPVAEGPGSVRRIVIQDALSVRFGREVENGVLTLLVRRTEPEAPSPWLATVGLEALPEWSIWVLRPQADGLELWAGGIVTPPVPPLFTLFESSPGTSDVFLARHRHLFVVDRGTPRLLLDGFEPKRGPEMLYLSF